jgi:hypothetical protein
MSGNPLSSRRAQLGPASEERWIPLSDLMSGLMMMFMLVAVLFMVQVEAESRNTRALKDKAEAEALRAQTQAERMRDVADIYRDMREALYRDLYTEFAPDLKR